jgi:dTDP-glucose 4,6-dehydratase
VLRTICDLLDQTEPPQSGPRHRLNSFVDDRPGHDRRYAIDPTKIETELGWRAEETLETGLTVRGYLENRAWWQAIIQCGYSAKPIGMLRGQPEPQSKVNPLRENSSSPGLVQLSP